MQPAPTSFIRIGMDTTTTRGAQLRGARTTLGYTQKQVADHLGVTVPTVWNWENDRTTPGRDHQTALDRFLQIVSEETA